jgi:hypothetical protein
MSLLKYCANPWDMAQGQFSRPGPLARERLFANFMAAQLCTTRDRKGDGDSPSRTLSGLLR